jgi:hypothetical protein
VIVLIFLLAGAVFADVEVFRLSHASRKQANATQSLAHQVEKVANTALRLATEIQEQRVSTTRTNCQNQNARRADTISRLDRQLAPALAAATSPTQKAQLRATRNAAIFIISGIVPKQDCDLLVSRATGSGAAAGPPGAPPIIIAPAPLSERERGAG